MRSYAARGYFAANAHRPNLHVLCGATVAKIDLDGKKATGVTFIHNDQKHTVGVKKEVIVAGGAIHSPAILELSGIGDPEILRKAGVEPKIENKAVGENFQDHVMSVSLSKEDISVYISLLILWSARLLESSEGHRHA